ncbi:MAG: imidazolonepropionase [Flavisolibacter sp.]
MAILFTHIQTLANTRENYHLLRGKDLEELPCLDNAYLIVEGEEILEYGLMDQLRFHPRDFQFHYDVPGQCILPSWCDSHTHLVFPSSREEEFVDKIRGLTYAEIAAKGGGILQTARKLQDTTEEELYRRSRARLVELMKLGTGAVEIKSGYGLSLEGELKMLRVIRRLKNSLKIPVKASFLGAHAIPEVFRDNREAYLQLITQEMLPAIAREGLADYVDVFCEEGFFTPGETERICEAGKHFGLRPKIHANQLHASGGVQAGVRLGALSVDHLETMDDPAIQALAASSTIGTLLPTAAFFLRMPYQPARKLIENNCAIALASDFNPGSSPSGNMNFVVALSCIQMRMLPAEAINAATLNGAYAMEMEDEMGSITVGKKASFILTKPIPSLSYLPYAFGSNLIDRVMLGGDWVE